MGVERRSAQQVIRKDQTHK